MENLLIIMLVLMIIAALTAIHAKDLISSIIAQSFIGYGLVVCFLLLKAPELALVQIILETVTLIIVLAVVCDSSMKEINEPIGKRDIITYSLSFVLVALFLYYFDKAIVGLDPFGEHTLRMSEMYVKEVLELTGSANLVKGVLWDFRGLDTLGEATVLFTAAMGVLVILRITGKKQQPTKK